MQGAISDAACNEAIDAARALSGLTIPAASREAVRMHLRNSLAIAASLGEVGPEAAPVFRA